MNTLIESVIEIYENRTLLVYASPPKADGVPIFSVKPYFDKATAEDSEREVPEFIRDRVRIINGNEFVNQMIAYCSQKKMSVVVNFFRLDRSFIGVRFTYNSGDIEFDYLN